MTTTERVQAHRERQTSAGKMQVNVTLPESTVKRLDKLCERGDLTRAELIAELIKGAK